MCLEITKPETIERLQELLEKKLRRSLEEVPDYFKDAGGFETDLRDSVISVMENSGSINSLTSSLWHNTSLKQQQSQSEDDYEFILACKLQTSNGKISYS